MLIMDFHAENRNKICLLCLKKAKLKFKIEGAIQKNLESVLNCDLNFYISDNKLPASPCSSCNRNVYFAKNNKVNREFQIKLPDFSRFTEENIPTQSRELKHCECALCELARFNSLNRGFVTLDKEKK